MKNKMQLHRFLSILVCCVLIAAIALTAMGCAQRTQSPETQKVSFTFVVVDGAGNEKSFQIDTEEKTVGAALLKEGLIEGDSGEYGLYVKTVNGITADYEKDGTYWAFYINGEYAMTGVDATEITAGEIYSFRVEAG